jgi:hypothetical protein
VRALQVTVARERVQVTPDRGRVHTERDGELLGLDIPREEQETKNLAPPLPGSHGGSSWRDPVSIVT